MKVKKWRNLNIQASEWPDTQHPSQSYTPKQLSLKSVPALSPYSDNSGLHT